jgi:Holliday junction resolvase RusA-like endonuclease
MRELAFSAAIIPVSWQRAGRRGACSYTPPQTARAKKAIADAFRAAYPKTKPHEGPVGLAVTSVFQAPVSWPRWKRALAVAGLWPCTNQKDVDNLAKCVMDALNAVAYVDDRQIVMLATDKQYGDAPRVMVTLRLLDEPTRADFDRERSQGFDGSRWIV